MIEWPAGDRIQVFTQLALFSPQVNRGNMQEKQSDLNFAFDWVVNCATVEMFNFRFYLNLFIMEMKTLILINM